MNKYKQALIIWLLGNMSGFTIMISGNTLNFWLADSGINLTVIGLFAIVSIPYAINFLWAPVFDTIKLPYLDKLLDQRLSWLCAILLLLTMATLSLSKLDPVNALIPYAILATIISLLASAQDTILGALRSDLVIKEHQGSISAIYIFGYRIGMLLSGSGAIYLSYYLSWQQIYQLFAYIILLYCLVVLLLSKVINNMRYYKGIDIYDDHTDKTERYNFFRILRPIGSTKILLLIILFLILYRIPDNFINNMINPFLLHIGYDAVEIASNGKFWGVLSAISGGLLAGKIMKKIGLITALFWFGIIHALSHLLFIVQEVYGYNIYILWLAIGVESLTSGMVMVAYIAFITSLCQGKYKATQYSFLTAMMGLSRALFPALSGYLVVKFGWSAFFSIVTLMSLPSLYIIYHISKKLI